ncbi:MAG: UDP-N-acetylmuramoyl-L-alanine--D-glutamate ligase [bacterium]|nr:UDP-N-acetylmuramoyl-L-alanine--D-glutamate ligase [bacterium]
MNAIPKISGRKITVLGAERSGMAAVKLLLRKGAKVFLSDIKYSVEVENKCSEIIDNNFQFELGEHSDKIFNFSDMFVISPGIPLDIPVIKKAREKNIPVYGELEIAYLYCKSPIIAVTGTNGKSTVTMMIKNIFDTSGKPAVAAGNIGLPFADIVDTVSNDTTIVLEVSSYQLETMNTFHPNISVILNITPDHIYRHKTMDEYTRCKFRIFENQTKEDILLLNRDDKVLNSPDLKNKPVSRYFSGNSPVSNGAGFSDGILYYYLDGNPTEIMNVSVLRVPGRHNIENAAAAAAASVFGGVENTALIADALKSFKGLEHRLEYVISNEGITFINDSKATNLNSLDTALNAYDQKLILIAGGQEKGTDYSSINSLISEKVKTLVLYGESRTLMAAAWGNSVDRIVDAEDLRSAVSSAYREAVNGDIVLLSPGCPSFDMFNDFEERGRIFKKIVNALFSN